MCPKPCLPEFGTPVLTCEPADPCPEPKSFKPHLLGYRKLGILQENVAGKVLQDMVSECGPATAAPVGHFNARGGQGTAVGATHPDQAARTPGMGSRGPARRAGYFLTHFCSRGGPARGARVSPANTLPAPSAPRPSGSVPSMNSRSEPSRALPIRTPFFQP